MSRKTSLLACGYALVLLMGVAADTAHAGPDPPQGKYGITIKLNDGTWEEVAVGDPVIFNQVGVIPQNGGNPTYGVEVHGKLNLPNPPAGGGFTWRVRCVSFFDLDDWQEAAGIADLGGCGPIAWTGQVVNGEWSMFCVPEFGVWWQTFPGTSYAVTFQLEVNGPGIGGWAPAVTVVGYFNA